MRATASRALPGETRYVDALAGTLMGGVYERGERENGVSSVAFWSLQATPRKATVWLVAVLGIAMIGGIDYYTGVELRVFPLYYAPISLLAWHVGTRSALLAAALSAATWLGFNVLGGLEVSSVGIWIANTFVQGASFATVGFLIASLKGALTRERGLSRTDSLTSLLNRRAFFEDAEPVLSLCRRKRRPVTLAYIDLDNFKTVNDTFGHQAGDDVLCRVGAVLRASTRPSDLCARLGGDEFAVLLTEANADDAAAALQRLRVLLCAATDSVACPISGSIGAVTFLTIPHDMEEMVRAADDRMYAAKAEGKNRLRLEVAS